MIAWERTRSVSHSNTAIGRAKRSHSDKYAPLCAKHLSDRKNANGTCTVRREFLTFVVAERNLDGRNSTLHPSVPLVRRPDSNVCGRLRRADGAAFATCRANRTTPASATLETDSTGTDFGSWPTNPQQSIGHGTIPKCAVASTDERVRPRNGR